VPDLDPEDAKILTLARGARLRAHAPHTGVAEGAAVRDADGRTYAGATVELPSLQLSALAVAVAMASSSAAAGLEAVAVVTDSDDVTEDDLAVVRDFAGAGIPVFRADARGQLQDTLTT
jgi:cytidine deaminase